MTFTIRFTVAFLFLFASLTALAIPSVSPSSLDFSSSPQTQTVTITNPGGGKSDKAILISPTIAPSDAAFEVGTSSDTPCPLGTPLDLGKTCKLNVTFKGTTGTSSATLTASPDVPNLTVTLTGTAQNTVSKVTLNLEKMGTGQGTITSTPAGIDCGPTCDFDFEANKPVTLTATPDANSTFTEWAGGCSGNNPTCQVTMDAAKNVTATFASTPPPISTTPTSFSLNLDKGNGEVKCNQGNCESTYPPNTPIALTAIPPTGFQFDGWSGDCTGKEDCNLLMDKDKTVKAMFIQQTVVAPEVTNFPLTVNPTTGEVKCDDATCNPQYPRGTTVTLTAIPKPGNELANWEGCTPNPADPKVCRVTMDSAKTVTAHFKVSNVPVTPATTVPLTVNPTTGEVKCDGATCNPQYPQGTAVTLTATPKPGYKFARWEGCTSTPTDSKICVVTMDSPKTVTATFNPVSPLPVPSFPLQVYLTGPGKVLCNNVECLPNQTSYSANTPVTLTAVPTPGNTFTGWAGACMGNIIPCQLTMSEAKTVSATFELPLPSPPVQPVIQPVMMIHVVPTCATDSTSISDTCKGQGKSLACNVTIERSANLSNVRFACDATNRGWIANSTIQTGITVTGGVFTGYITNQGTLADFEFRGASIIGGTLSGKIVNKSKVGGYFKDVHLAPGTYITGGTVTGTITGDCQTPATLENLKVKAGSRLSCVELGKKVKLEKNVTVEKESD